jgi:hypothetical protein
MIKKIKITGVWVGEEKTLTAKKGPNAGQSFVVCKIGIFTDDNDAEYGKRFISGSISADKYKTAKEKAEAFKKEIVDAGGKEIIIDIEESEVTDPKTNKPYVNFKFLSKDKMETAKQFLK